MKWRMLTKGTFSRWYFVAGLLWLGRFATLGHMPWQTPVWSDWFDQSRYLISAQAFARGDLSMEAHWYSLAYPLAAAPFTFLSPRDPFLPLDLSLFLVTCRAFQKVVGRLDIGTWSATWCFLLTTIAQTGLAVAWAQPWTTTLAAALIWWLIDRTLAIGEQRAGEERLVALALIGALVGGLPLVRPVDGLLSLTCLVVVGLSLSRRHALSPAAVLAVAGGGLAVCGVYAALHLAIYGPHPTPYMIAAAHTGFIWRDLGWKAYLLLVDAEAWYPGSRAILQVLPWIVPGCAGLVATGLVGSRRERYVIALLFLLIVPVSAVMLTYADLQPPGLWRFGNIHYFKWIMPAFGAGLILVWRLLRRAAGRRALGWSLVALLVPLAVRVTPVTVDDQVPARMLLFKGATTRVWDEAYFASVVIIDDRGRMSNVGDFHQLPDRGGEREVAISRPFGPHPRRFDPGEQPTRDGQLPYARYGERVSILGLGVP